MDDTFHILTLPKGTTVLSHDFRVIDGRLTLLLTTVAHDAKFRVEVGTTAATDDAPAIPAVNLSIPK